MQFSACTRIAKNKHAVNRSIIVFYSTPALCVQFFGINECSVLLAFSLLLERYVKKGNDAKNPAILSFLFVTERTQLNAAHAQLL